MRSSAALAASSHQEVPMFDTIVSQIANLVRRTVGAIASITQRAPWLAVLAVALVVVLW